MLREMSKVDKMNSSPNMEKRNPWKRTICEGSESDYFVTRFLIFQIITIWYN